MSAKRRPFDPNALTWPRHWDTPLIALGGADVTPLINECRERRRQMMTVLANVDSEQGRHSAIRMQRRFLCSSTVLIHSFARAYSRKIAHIEPENADEVAPLLVAASKTSPWKGTGEKAFKRIKWKKNGGHRMIHIRQTKTYGNELLAIDAATPLADLLDTQYNSNGGGSHGLEEMLRDKLPSTKVVITVDIPHCFDVMKRSSVADNLPLPMGVIQRVLFDPTDHAIPVGVPKGFPMDHVTIVKAGSAKRGFAQGAALSSLASEVVLAKVLRTVAERHPAVTVASQGDNLLFLLEDASDAESVILFLTLSVTEHFGGDVSAELACRIHRSYTADGFWFCKRHYSWRNGKLSKRLPDEFVSDFVLRTNLAILDASAAKDALAFGAIERSIKGWLSAVGHLKGVLIAAAELLSKINDWKKAAAKWPQPGQD